MALNSVQSNLHSSPNVNGKCCEILKIEQDLNIFSLSKMGMVDYLTFIYKLKYYDPLLI
mgnify:FL=1